jgi:glycosyltransferase involved in cell wall biosynthesis
MTVGIDATNIKSGGGLTHLIELINHLIIEDHAIDKIIVFGGKSLDQLPVKDWLLKKKYKELDEHFMIASYWKVVKFTQELKKNKVDILFNPGGVYVGSFRPVVTMSQNMLVYEKKERDRYRWSHNWIRLLALNILQSYTAKRSDGIIFISNYASSYIKRLIPNLKYTAMIYHGISDRFRCQPKKQYPIQNYCQTNRYVLTYTSTIEQYKHQDKLILAISELNKLGYSIQLKLIGVIGSSRMKKKMEPLLKLYSGFVDYLGLVPFEEIHEYYLNTDGFIFASTCENMPNIVIEAMSAGLPIISSNFGPMPEVLKDAALYFDPTDIVSIKKTIVEFLENVEKRKLIANKAYEYSKSFSWQLCSHETFMFLSKVFSENKK